MEGWRRDAYRYVHVLALVMQLLQMLSGIFGPSHLAFLFRQKSQARSTFRFLEPFPSTEESMA